MTPTPPIKLFCLFTFLICTLTLSAQYKQGFKNLESGQLEAAYAIFSGPYADETNMVCNQYGLAKLYGNPAFSRFNADSAYAQILRAEKSFRKLDYKSRKKLEKTINSTEIRNTKKGIIEVAYSEIEKNPSLEAYNNFLKSIKRPPYKIKTNASKARNKLAYAQAMQENTLDAWKDFQRYNGSLKTHNPGLYKKGQEALFQAYFRENSWALFDSFALKYPNNPYVLDTGAKDFVAIANKGKKKIFENFNKKHPESLFVEISKDTINKYKMGDIRTAEQPAKIFNFIKMADLDEYDEALDQQLRKLFLQEPILNNFIDKLPEGKFESLLPLTTAAIFEEYAQWGEKQKLEYFSKKFPNFKDSLRLNQELELADSYDYIGSYYTAGKEAEFKAYIRDAAPRHSAYRSLVRMIKPKLVDNKYEEALELVREVKPYFGADNYWLKNIEEALLNDDQTVEKVNLGTKVNSTAAEYVPVLSADGNTIYFCGYKREDCMGGEDIFVSEKVDGIWTQSTIIKELCSDWNNEAPFEISTDKTRIFVFIGGDLFYHDLTKNGWSEKQAVSHINTTSWECDLNLSKDGKVMFFTSNRPDMIGVSNSSYNIDIFVSLKDDEGNWGKPFNIGKTLNTPFIDRTPFLHPDMKTLYFSSDGHGSIGDMDVFITTRLDDTWKNWSTPVNLGKMINTPERDWGYRISTDGTLAYFAAGKSSDEDLYQVNLPEEFRPDDVSTISGTLTDNNGEAVSAEIIVKDLETDKVVGVYKSNPMTGAYFFTLPQDKRYGYHIQKDGHYPISDNLDLRDVEEGEDIKQDLTIVTMDELVEKGVTLPLVNLFFDTDKYEIKPASFAELDRLADIVKENNHAIEIRGHTDDVGTEAYNLALSEKRAQAVRTYLIQKGCSSDKIAAKGFGEKRPEDSNQTMQGRAKNRRVEVRFIK